MIKVAVFVFARVPIVHEPDVLLKLPTDAVAPTNKYPEGNLSVTITPVASLGPALLTLIVKVTTSLTLGVALLTNFVKLKSTNGPRDTVT